MSKSKKESGTPKNAAPSKERPKHRRASDSSEAPSTSPIPSNQSSHPQLSEDQKANQFPIVGVGASAGGLEAFRQLLENLPVDTGMAFVLVQHLDPEHESALTHLLSRATSMPVSEITNNQRVLADHIFVIPRDTNLSIVKGVLQLQPRPRTRTPHRPIDSFFESLAQDQQERAIGVVLSGTASDGTLGLEAIKGEGGITFAQDDSAKYDSMPRSAVAAGCVDLVLSPAGIAKELARIGNHPFVKGRAPLTPFEGKTAPATAHEDDQTPLPARSGGSEAPRTDAQRIRTEANREGPRSGVTDAKGEDGYKKILLLLRNQSGVDFSLYKSSTIQRRINRRLVLSKRGTLQDYASFLRGNVKELDNLYSDVLISVTSFFRNPETFDALQREVFPKLLRQRGDGPLRCWVLGCSTGQEAYSLAMAFLEAAEKVPHMRSLQIFATDLNDALLDKARHGLYAKSLAEDVTPERLRRFFVEEEGGYRISKKLREMVVFARQNLINDPPFSRMDIISCRNLLIYLEPSLQKKAIPTFHYALKPDGFLLLGASESIGGFTDLFEPVDKKNKVYSKRPAPTPTFHLPVNRERSEKFSAARRPPLPIRQTDESEAPAALRGELNAQREADRITVNQFAPPGVLVNSELQVLQFRGPTEPYLQPPAGKASFDVLKMAREGLMLPLRAAINQAKKENKTARRNNVRVNRNGKALLVNLEIVPLKNLHERHFLILFEETRKVAGAGDSASRTKSAMRSSKISAKQDTNRISELETDLSETRDYLQSMQEQHEGANEELQAANEEVQSSNEELQSINEELETSKEELESANEELTTVNEEMSNRNIELNLLNSDMTNLQNSTKLVIVLLRRDLTIRRFSAQAEKQFDLLATDIGRPIANVRHNLLLDDMESFVRDVIDTVHEQTRDVQDKLGRWYSLRVRPYMTLDNKVDGAVLVLVDVDTLKRSEQAVAAARNYAEAIIRTARDALIVLRGDLRVDTANEAFYKMFKTAPGQTEGIPIFEIAGGAWEMPKLRTLLEEVLPRNSFFHDFEVTNDFPRLGKRTMLLNAQRLQLDDGTSPKILLSIQDMTERLQFQTVLRHSEGRYRRLFEAAHDGILILDSVTRQIADANPFMTELLGYAKDELLGKELWEIGLLADEQASHASFRQLQQQGSVRYESVPLESKSGEKREVEIVANRYEEDGKAVIQCNIRDITERRMAQEALRESEERYRTLFELGPVAVYSCDDTGVIQQFNRRAAELWGREPAPGDTDERFCGSFKLFRSDGSFMPHEQCPMAEMVSGKISVVNDMEVLIERPDGSRITVIVNIRPLKNEHGKVVGAINCFYDITERKRFESERVAQADRELSLRMEAENANRSKDIFLATLSHEMRTPLNAIVGWINILKRSGYTEKDLQEGLDVIERNTKAQVQLIEDVLDVSRIVSGKLRLEIRPCELSEVIAAGIDAVRPAAEARGIALNVQLDPAVTQTRCDAVRIQQVVWNLVSNAVKFTPKGGQVSITLTREHSGVQMQVSDSGQGISSDLLPYVFDRFRQADSSTRRKFGGLGLGLSIVKHIIEMHGGTIAAASPGEGLGSTFTVRLPIHAIKIDEEAADLGIDESDAAQPTVSSQAVVRLDGLRVLVVDDEADSRRLLAKVLSEAGAIVTTAESAAEAMPLLKTENPSILVSDLGMPNEDGFDLIYKVRQSYTPNVLPAVALTAFAHKEDRRRALDAGFQVHISKPTDPHDLTAVVAELASNYLPNHNSE